MQLREIAHARTGDKGDTCQIAVIVYKEEDFEHLLKQVTAEKVRAYFPEIVRGAVTRHEVPYLGAVIFVLEHALGSGVTRSLSLDPHGKCLGATLLSMEISDRPMRREMTAQ